jgi:H+/gluconate symporter-like permease
MLTSSKESPESKQRFTKSMILAYIQLLVEIIIEILGYITALLICVFSIYCLVFLMFGSSQQKDDIGDIFAKFGNNWVVFLLLVFPIFYTFIKWLFSKTEIRQIWPPKIVPKIPKEEGAVPTTAPQKVNRSKRKKGEQKNQVDGEK